MRHLFYSSKEFIQRIVESPRKLSPASTTTTTAAAAETTAANSVEQQNGTMSMMKFAKRIYPFHDATIANCQPLVKQRTTTTTTTTPPPPTRRKLSNYQNDCVNVIGSNNYRSSLTDGDAVVVGGGGGGFGFDMINNTIKVKDDLIDFELFEHDSSASNQNFEIYHGIHKNIGDVTLRVFNSDIVVEFIKKLNFLVTIRHENFLNVYSCGIGKCGIFKDRYYIMTERCSQGDLAAILDKEENRHGLNDEDFKLFLQSITSCLRQMINNSSNETYQNVKLLDVCCHVNGNNKKKIFKLLFINLKEIVESSYYFHPRNLTPKTTNDEKSSEENTFDLWTIGCILYQAATGKKAFVYQNAQSPNDFIEKLKLALREKRSDTISMVEISQNKWTQYDKLPATINMSRSLAKSITPLIIGLLDWPSRNQWTLERYFQICDEILTQSNTNNNNNNNNPMDLSTSSLYYSTNDDVKPSIKYTCSVLREKLLQDNFIYRNMSLMTISECNQYLNAIINSLEEKCPAIENDLQLAIHNSAVCEFQQALNSDQQTKIKLIELREELSSTILPSGNSSPPTTTTPTSTVVIINPNHSTSSSSTTNHHVDIQITKQEEKEENKCQLLTNDELNWFTNDNYVLIQIFKNQVHQQLIVNNRGQTSSSLLLDIHANFTVILNFLNNFVHILIAKYLRHNRCDDRSNLSRASILFEKLFKEVLDIYLQMEKLHSRNLLSNQFYEIEKLLKILIRNSFIIVTFPTNGIVKRQTKGAAGTKIPISLANLLPFAKLGLKASDFTINVSYMEGDPNYEESGGGGGGTNGSNSSQPLISRPVPSRWQISTQNEGLRHVFICQDLKLTDVGTSSHSAMSKKRVTEKKGVFVFHASLTGNQLHHLTKLPFVEMERVSDTVIPIVHTNQEWQADFNLFLDSFFPQPNRLDFSVLETTTVDVLVEKLSDYMKFFTGRGLTMPCQKEFMREKLLSTCCSVDGKEKGEILLQNLGLTQITKSLSFWNWLWSCLKMFRESKEKNANIVNLREMWLDGLIIGFVGRAKANRMCQQSLDNYRQSHHHHHHHHHHHSFDVNSGPFILRFSENIESSISVATHNNSWQPFRIEELRVKSLANYLMEYNMLTYFEHLGMEKGDKKLCLDKYSASTNGNNHNGNEEEGGYVVRGSTLNDHYLENTEKQHSHHHHSHSNSNSNSNSHPNPPPPLHHQHHSK